MTRRDVRDALLSALAGALAACAIAYAITEWWSLT